MSWYITYKICDNKKPRNKKICKEVFWRRYILDCMKLFENYDISKSFLLWIFKTENKPDISDLLWVEEKYKQLCDNFKVKPNFKPIREKIIDNYNLYLQHTNYTCKFSDTPMQGNNILKIPKYDLSYRKKWGYKWTAKEEVLSTIKHNILSETMPGNQWTMLTNERIENLKEAGHNMEVFGSPFNTRMRYFGSLYECDEPFGRVGNCWSILDIIEEGKALLWRNKIVIPAHKKAEQIHILICPPSGTALNTAICEKVVSILNKRRAEIYLNIPAFTDKFIDIVRGKYMIGYIKLNKSWDFYAAQNYKVLKNYKVSKEEKKIGTVYSKERYNKSYMKKLVEIDMTGREWYLILLRSF